METAVPPPVGEMAALQPEQPEVPEAAEPERPQSAYPPLGTSRSSPRQVVATQVGTYTKTPSVELRTYYMFMGLGESGFSSPETTKQEFDLSDEKLAKLTEYAKFAVELMQQNQALICRRKFGARVRHSKPSTSL